MKFEHSIAQRVRAVALSLSLLVLVGVVTRPIETRAWNRVQSGQPELNLIGVEDALGQGLVIGMLGGFRAIMADFLWIRANMIWELRDHKKLDPTIRLVTILDPRPDFFWINSARMIAYDVPNWRILEEGGYGLVPDWRQEEIDVEQANKAFFYLSRALDFHPENPRVHLEIGQIYLNRLNDPARAGPWFLSASELPGAPSYAARIYAELLCRQGKDREAYGFLVDLHAVLSDSDPFAQKNIVLERIRDLEETLQIALLERYQPYAEANN